MNQLLFKNEVGKIFKSRTLVSSSSTGNYFLNKLFLLSIMDREEERCINKKYSTFL